MEFKDKSDKHLLTRFESYKLVKLFLTYLSKIIQEGEILNL